MAAFAKFAKDSFQKFNVYDAVIWSDNKILIRSYCFKFIKDCLPKILVGLKGSIVKTEKFYLIF